jgi:hypothetical protein
MPARTSLPKQKICGLNINAISVNRHEWQRLPLNTLSLELNRRNFPPIQFHQKTAVEAYFWSCAINVASGPNANATAIQPRPKNVACLRSGDRQLFADRVHSSGPKQSANALPGADPRDRPQH